MIEEKGILLEVKIFLTKIAPYASAILFGLIGKVGMELMMKRKYTFLQWVGIFSVSIFFGYMTALMCESKGWEDLGKWLPSFATLFGQQIALYFVYNSKSIFDRILKAVLNK